MVLKVIIVISILLDCLNISMIVIINDHINILAKAVQQEQYQIDVITQWIKGISNDK